MHKIPVDRMISCCRLGFSTGADVMTELHRQAFTALMIEANKCAGPLNLAAMAAMKLVLNATAEELAAMVRG